MKHIKTIEQAQALPEIESEMFEYYTEIDPKTHRKITKSRMRKLSPIGIDGDDIILFVDKDGRSMKVVGTEKGACKVEFYI